MLKGDATPFAILIGHSPIVKRNDCAVRKVSVARELCPTWRSNPLPESHGLFAAAVFKILMKKSFFLVVFAPFQTGQSSPFIGRELRRELGSVFGGNNIIVTVVLVQGGQKINTSVVAMCVTSSMLGCFFADRNNLRHWQGLHVFLVGVLSWVMDKCFTANEAVIFPVIYHPLQPFLKPQAADGQTGSALVAVETGEDVISAFSFALAMDFWVKMFAGHGREWDQVLAPLAPTALPLILSVEIIHGVFLEALSTAQTSSQASGVAYSLCNSNRPHF